jgi:outer membrane lipoprotein-sorting protein
MGNDITVGTKRVWALCQAMCLLLWAGQSPASEPAEEKGLTIAIAADQRDAGFSDSTVDLTMLLNISKTEQVTREMRQMTLEVDGDGDKSIMVFDRPRDLKGAAILTFTHKVGSDDQWLYLPALKRVKRISSADKSGPFMGSEFAYEDLASQEVEKYSYTYLRDEIQDEELSFVVERIPVDKKSGYTRQVTWIDQNEYRLRRVDYYDRKGDLLKTMNMVGYQQYLDHYWRPDEMHMTNHQTGKSTILKFNNYQFRVGLADKDFSRGALPRIR